MSTHDTVPAIEERLRAALAARADLVQAGDLAPLGPAVEPRPQWQSPWALLATAAAVLLVLGVVLHGVAGGPRSDRLAPQPDAPQVQLPPDVGRGWAPDDLSTPARLDLDGDGTREKVEFLAEPSEGHDGRTRVQTTLSTTGEEAYGVVALGTTIGVNALDPIDADADGDQELVLYTTDARRPRRPLRAGRPRPARRAAGAGRAGGPVAARVRRRRGPRLGDRVLRPGAPPVVRGRGRTAGLDPLGERVRPVGGPDDPAPPGDVRRGHLRVDARRGRCAATGGGGLPRAGAGGHHALRRRQRRRPALRDERVHRHHRRRGASGRARRRRPRLPRARRGRRLGAGRSWSTDPVRTARSTRSRSPTRGSTA